jgi:hypothetical protein
VENAFGILANRFRVLLRTMAQQPETVRLMVMACVCLHNLMRTRYPVGQNGLMDREDANHHWTKGIWREGEQLESMQTLRGNVDTKTAKEQRDQLMAYYNGPGKVHWQEDMI